MIFRTLVLKEREIRVVEAQGKCLFNANVFNSGLRFGLAFIKWFGSFQKTLTNHSTSAW